VVTDPVLFYGHSVAEGFSLWTHDYTCFVKGMASAMPQIPFPIAASEVDLVLPGDFVGGLFSA
jgi:hypothetical protein